MKQFIYKFHQYTLLNEELMVKNRFNTNDEDFGIVLDNGKVYTFNTDSNIVDVIKDNKLTELEKHFIENGIIYSYELGDDYESDKMFVDIFWRFNSLPSVDRNINLFLVSDGKLILRSNMLDLSHNSTEVAKIKKLFKIKNVEYYRKSKYNDLINNEKWYHASTYDNILSILKKGLIPSYNRRYEISQKGLLYVTQNISVLDVHSNFGAIFEFNLPDASLLGYDGDVESVANETDKKILDKIHNKMKIYSYKGRIPAKFITGFYIDNIGQYLIRYIILSLHRKKVINIKTTMELEVYIKTKNYQPLTHFSNLEEFQNFCSNEIVDMMQHINVSIKPEDVINSFFKQ